LGAPVAAAQVALDTHNAASFWNKALLDNSARPSGALVYAGPEGAHLTDAQFSRLKEELEENFSGATNAGRPLLLEGGLDWKALSLSPKDMDFTESKAGAAREIALAFGVPPLLLGLPGDNTFSNYAEANRAFWRQTVLPLVARVQKSFQAWLQPGFGSFRLDYNADRLEALASERAAEWERVGKAAFLTLDEQREALGYGPAPKDALVAKRDLALERRYSPDQPRVPAGNSGGGRWTSGGGGGSGGGFSGARDDRARRRDVEDRVQTAQNTDPKVASDVDGSITLAQARGRGRGGRFTGPGEATPSQLDRLEDTARLAREAETRVREIDPSWKPEPTLSDPTNIESRIERNENLTRQANARYAEHLRERYGEITPEGNRAPIGNLTGPRAPIRENDNAETRRGRMRENETADIVWLNGHNVERLHQRSNAEGVKQPDYRIDDEIFDAFAPKTDRARNVWSYAQDKVARKQSENIVINLSDSQATLEEIIAQFRAFPIPGLNRLWVIDQKGKLHYLFGGR